MVYNSHTLNTAGYPAPAKLNLFLHITSRRADGYHCLQTVFQFLDYSDTLHFTIRSAGEIQCQSTAIDIIPEQDLAWRAARLLKHYSGTSLGADILVEKRIPIGGGLGGGSSDAATVLLVLNELWQLGLSTVQLMALGLQLGADVPVFIQGQTAWAEGVGECLTPITLPEEWFLVVHPNCHVPTKEIFTDPDLIRNQSPITLQDFLDGQSCNICEPIVRKRYPPVGAALDWLSRYRPARMTGTGACVFASFPHAHQAQAVLAQLPSQWQGFIAQGLNRSCLKIKMTQDCQSL